VYNSLKSLLNSKLIHQTRSYTRTCLVSHTRFSRRPDYRPQHESAKTKTQTVNPRFMSQKTTDRKSERDRPLQAYRVCSWFVQERPANEARYAYPWQATSLQPHKIKNNFTVNIYFIYSMALIKFRIIPWTWRFWWYRENLVRGIPWYCENRPSLMRDWKLKKQ